MWCAQCLVACYYFSSCWIINSAGDICQCACRCLASRKRIADQTQGKSKGFDNCERPSNLAQIKLISSNVGPLTLKFDRWPRKIAGNLFQAPKKIRVSFHSHLWRQVWRMTLKNNRAPLKMTEGVPRQEKFRSSALLTQSVTCGLHWPRAGNAECVIMLWYRHLIYIHNCSLWAKSRICISLCWMQWMIHGIHSMSNVYSHVHNMHYSFLSRHFWHLVIRLESVQWYWYMWRPLYHR